jgi:3D-(3,5/4)-trihydroxycyclohexane-1,2-dione acylhydrolase (decyclizing)
LRVAQRIDRSTNGKASGRTLRMTVAQAVVRFLQVQHSERDGERRRLFPGMFGIFGHGNVAGLNRTAAHD